MENTYMENTKDKYERALQLIMRQYSLERRAVIRLRAENKRLRAENERLLAVVQAIAGDGIQRVSDDLHQQALAAIRAVSG
jgi:hypothetical protein